MCLIVVFLSVLTGRAITDPIFLVFFVLLPM